mgnify:CR=1 FL=1
MRSADCCHNNRMNLDFRTYRNLVYTVDIQDMVYD